MSGSHQISWKTLIPLLLRPPGGGIPTVSAGKGAALSLQKKHYSALNAPLNLPQEWTNEEIQKFWQESWDCLSQAQVVALGVPLDTGAGIRRGAAYGPRAVRETLLNHPQYRALLESGKLVDLGDIYVNPHLLHDEMLSLAQIQACQEMMYAEAPQELRSVLPVSALSALEFFLSALLKDYPHLKLMVIGGDHSVAWPVASILSQRYPGSLGIVQPDAHTDLLPSRLGVKYCFGTWSYHANDAIGRNGKLVQLGIRQSGRDKSHWESTLGVKQYWAEEILRRNADELIAELIAHLKSKGVRQIYFSNDIDGTDEAFASATGTPAPQGVNPEFFLKLISALGKNFELTAFDIMEVAPDLGTSEQKETTCRWAAEYVLACLEACLVS